jgi:hypothetical protein
MLDLYSYDKPHLPMDKLIELMFYSGEFLASIIIDKQGKSTTFLENMKNFDDVSINKLFNIKSYFENNNLVPNKQIVDLLDKVIKKLKTKHYSISSDKIVIIPEHISYLPVEITQLFCIIKPKQTSNVDMLIQKLNEITIQLSNQATIDILFNNLKQSVKLDDVPVITSILTPENDLEILGIDENAQDETEEEMTQDDLGLQQGLEVPQEETMSGGNFYNKYKKYKSKYLNLKYNK